MKATLKHLLALAFAGCAAHAANPKPNVLFLIADDASTHFGAYGCAWVKTPHTDRLAKAGLVFDQAYTPTSKCAPCRAAILTGRNPWQLEDAANHQSNFPAKFMAFSEALAKNGVHCGGATQATGGSAGARSRRHLRPIPITKGGRSSQGEERQEARKPGCQARQEGETVTLPPTTPMCGLRVSSFRRQQDHGPARSQGRARSMANLACLAACLLPPAVSCKEPTADAAPALKPPLHGLEEVGYQDVKLEGGFWGPRLEIHHKTTIPHVLDKLEQRHHIANFDVAARVVKDRTAKQGTANADQATRALEGDAGNRDPAGSAALSPTAEGGGIVGHSAFDSDLHKALEGACYTLGHCDDPALRKRVDGILDRIVAAQQDDGYLVSYFIAREPDRKWADMRTNHELYNAGHFFEFAVEHYRQTGDTKAIAAAKRFADHIDRTFGPGKRYEVCGHQEIELALVKLYRITGEKRYLDLCRFFLDERGHAHGLERKPFTPVPFVQPERGPGLTDEQYRRVVWRARLYWRNGRMQDHKPLLEQTEAVGHAVRAGYTYAAMADLARFSDAPEYARAVRILWEDVVRRKMYITGGIGTAQFGDEGFGDPYVLPNRTYCESCACIANVLWQHRMSLMEADARYADVMELALYNSAIAGIALAGDGFFYQNPLESRNGAARSEWIGLACCPTNHARLTPQVGGLVYARRDGKLHVNLYAAGEAAIDMGGDKKVRLRQETSFPWDGKVKLSVVGESPCAFDLCVRIPGWARGNPVPGDLYRSGSPAPSAVTLAVNGEAVDATPGKDGYVALSRTWKPGDVVELELPMPVRRVLAHERLVENRGKVVLMRGPVVYSLEGVDNPGVDLFKVALPCDAELTTTHRPDLLNGVTVVQTTGLDEQGKPVKLTAVPCYAWTNRGQSPMNIWIHEAKGEAGRQGMGE